VSSQETMALKTVEAKYWRKIGDKKVFSEELQAE
jgi:hypothetical protein